MSEDQIKQLKNGYVKVDYNYDNNKYDRDSGLKVLISPGKKSPKDSPKKLYDYICRNGNDKIKVLGEDKKYFHPKLNKDLMEFFEPKSPSLTTTTKITASVGVSEKKIKEEVPVDAKAEEEHTDEEEEEKEEEVDEYYSDGSDYGDAMGGEYEDQLPQPTQTQTKTQTQTSPKPKEKQIQAVHPLEDDLIADLCSQLENILDFLSTKECTKENSDLSFYTRKYLKQLQKK